MKLGKIKEIDIRKVWAHEQYDFSKWLAAEENIKELGDSLNLSLTDVETEKFVGSYRCDIICKDELSGKAVLIENQLEQTNHDHLGKIITYASGLDASVVVWIVAEAREEHASAIEWLNKHCDSKHTARKLARRWSRHDVKTHRLTHEKKEHLLLIKN